MSSSINTSLSITSSEFPSKVEVQEILGNVQRDPSGLSSEVKKEVDKVNVIVQNPSRMTFQKPRFINRTASTARTFQAQDHGDCVEVTPVGLIALAIIAGRKGGKLADKTINFFMEEMNTQFAARYKQMQVEASEKGKSEETPKPPASGASSSSAAGPEDELPLPHTGFPAIPGHLLATISTSETPKPPVEAPELEEFDDDEFIHTPIHIPEEIADDYDALVAHFDQLPAAPPVEE